MGRQLNKRESGQVRGPASAARPTRGCSPAKGWRREALDLVPVPLRIDDFSEVKRHVERLRSGGVTDLQGYLDGRPREVLALNNLVRTVWMNEAAQGTADGGPGHSIPGARHGVAGKEAFEVFKENVVALSDGLPEFIRQVTVRTGRGEARHLLLHAKVDSSCLHDLSRVCVVATDVTSIKESEQEVKESEATYRSAFEMAPVPMVMVDVRTEAIVDTNSSARLLFGYEAEQLQGRAVGQLCSEDCAESLEGLVRGRQSLAEELRLRRQDGREVRASVSACSLPSGSRPSAVLVFFPGGTAASVWDRRARLDRRAASELRRKLSERERLILTLIASGHTNQKIADRLHISRKTVETHRLRIMQKLDVHKAADLVRYALASGLLGA